MKDTVQQYAPDLQIIYYVRDPRGTAASRFNNHDLAWSDENIIGLIDICAKYRENMYYLNSPESDWLTGEYKNTGKSRLFMLRFEDFGLNPFEISEKIYDYYGIDKKGYKNVVKYFEKNTKTKMNSKTAQNPYSTIRNSSETIFKWRTTVNWNGVKAIQDFCGEDVMKWLGYKTYNEEEYAVDIKDRALPLLDDWAFKGKFYDVL